MTEPKKKDTEFATIHDLDDLRKDMNHRFDNVANEFKLVRQEMKVMSRDLIIKLGSLCFILAVALGGYITLLLTVVKK